MTQQDFIAFYPQFSSFTPAVVLRETVALANGRFSDMEDAEAEEARRLYTAHKLTLYAFTVPPSGSGAAPDPAAIASAGRAAGARRTVTGKKAGEVSVTCSSESLSANTASSLADLTATAYGLQLLTLLRLYGRPVYIP